MADYAQLPPPGMDPEAYRLQLGITKEEMIAMFGEPKSPWQQSNFMQTGLSQYYQPQPPAPSQGGMPPVSLSAPGGNHIAGYEPLPPHAVSAATSYSADSAPLQDRRTVHHDDKQWLKSYQAQHPELSRKKVKDAFIATFGRVPA